MKKYIYVLLILFAFGLQGCNDKEYVGTGKGEIHYNGNIYRLYNASRRIMKGSELVDGTFHYTYFHELNFHGINWGNPHVRITIRSEKSKLKELESGEFYLRLITVNHWLNYIQMRIDLNDPDHPPLPYPVKKVYLSIAEKDDVFDIELRNNDFFITYRGLVPETWN